MTCAKKVVICIITTTTGEVITGENWCINPQTTCPRLPGEGYAKCKSICDQPGHAEENALFKLAIANINRKPELKIASVELTGIGYVCQACQMLLTDAGVTEVTIRGEVVSL